MLNTRLVESAAITTAVEEGRKWIYVSRLSSVRPAPVKRTRAIPSKIAAMDNGIQELRRLLNRECQALNRENPFYIALLVVLGLSPLLAYSIPEHVLTLWPWANSFTDIMVKIIPSIERLAEISTFPEVTRFFMSLQWAMWGPVCLWLMMRYGDPNEQKMIATLRIMQMRWWYFLFMPPLALVLSWYLIFFPFTDTIVNGPDFSDQVIRWMGKSQFWLGIIGSGFVFFTMLCVMGLLRSYTLIRLAYRVRKSTPFYKNKEREK